MERIFFIEIIAIFVGIVVIVIETVIIFLLLHHIGVMKRSFEQSHMIMEEFRKGINDHLGHMDDHSHKMEEAIEQIYVQVCHIGEDEKEPHDSQK
jgi:predicted Holliday junction resolvase-like endonuclease